jgi:hypothetical protein
MELLAILASAGLLAAADVPPYATPAHETTLTGTIAAFDGKYHLRLRDDRGTFDDVTLHRGTVITPTGQRLASGMRVSVSGAADGTTFAADEIDVAAEDATVAPEDYSPGPYTPLIGGYGTLCNAWNCAPYASCGGYSGCSYPGYFPGYYPDYYGAPYIIRPPIIVVPAPPNPLPSPAPFRLRRPLGVLAIPPPRALAPAPVYHAPAPPPQPHPRAVVPHVVGPHR